MFQAMNVIDAINFLAAIWRTSIQIIFLFIIMLLEFPGKSTPPHYQSNNMKSKAVWKNIQGEKVFVIRDTIDNMAATIDHETKTIIRTGEVPTHIPMAVFKCFVKEALNKSPHSSWRQIFRSASLKNLEIHQVFLRFFASRCMKICSPIRAR